MIDMKNMTFITRFSVSFFLSVSILLFVYSLGFFTNLNFTSQASQEFYDTAQAFNKTVFNFSVASIILAGIMIAADNHIKQLYNRTNQVINIAAIVLSLGVAIYTLLNVLHIKGLFKQLDYNSIIVFDQNFTPSLFVFHVGVVISILLFLAALLHLFVLLNSFKTTKTLQEVGE